VIVEFFDHNGNIVDYFEIDDLSTCGFYFNQNNPIIIDDVKWIITDIQITNKYYCRVDIIDLTIKRLLLINSILSNQ
jgi:hypothetical protein